MAQADTSMAIADSITEQYAGVMDEVQLADSYAPREALRRCSPRQHGRHKSGTLSRLNGRRTLRSSAQVRTFAARSGD